MDNGRGGFSGISESKFSELLEKEVGGLFKEGEIIEIRGSRFKVISIHIDGGLELKLIADKDVFETDEKLEKAIEDQARKIATKQDRNFFNKGKIHDANR